MSSTGRAQYWLGKTYEQAAVRQATERMALIAKSRTAYESMLKLDPPGRRRALPGGGTHGACRSDLEAPNTLERDPSPGLWARGEKGTWQEDWEEPLLVACRWHVLLMEPTGLLQQKFFVHR